MSFSLQDLGGLPTELGRTEVFLAYEIFPQYLQLAPKNRTMRMERLEGQRPNSSRIFRLSRDLK